MRVRIPRQSSYAIKTLIKNLDIRPIALLFNKTNILIVDNYDHFMTDEYKEFLYSDQGFLLTNYNEDSWKSLEELLLNFK